MIGIFQRLLDGDRSVGREFKKARVYWKRFFKGKRRWTVAQFAEWFGMYQTRYNDAIDAGNDSAKETFALTCLGTLYDEVNGWKTNGKLAVKVAKGILASTMSREIPRSARGVIRLYHLDDHDDELRLLVGDEPLKSRKTS